MVIIPFEISCNPMKKLAIINFEKNPDDVYKGLELQYFDDDKYGKGYRVIAYRCDGYVDVYDDLSLNYIENENFDVAGKGLGDRKMVPMESTAFQIENGGIFLSFRFLDKVGRTIIAKIREQTGKATQSMNLLAPIGSSSEKPVSLPLFFLFDFDFVRKYKTHVELVIDGKKVEQDNFPVPVPKDWQWRYYSRYTPDCQIVEFAKAKKCQLEQCTPDSAGLVQRGPLEYKYSNGSLEKIILRHSNHELVVEFGLGFPDVRNIEDGAIYADTFKVIPDDVMGSISGKYTIQRKANTAKIELSPSGGWDPVPNSFLTKVMFSKKSVFCSWPKTYRYVQNIDITTLESVSYWERIKP